MHPSHASLAAGDILWNLPRAAKATTMPSSMCDECQHGAATVTHVGLPGTCRDVMVSSIQEVDTKNAAAVQSSVDASCVAVRIHTKPAALRELFDNELLSYMHLPYDTELSLLDMLGCNPSSSAGLDSTVEFSRFYTTSENVVSKSDTLRGVITAHHTMSQPDVVVVPDLLIQNSNNVVSDKVPGTCDAWYEVNAEGKCKYTDCVVGSSFASGTSEDCFYCKGDCDNGCGYGMPMAALIPDQIEGLFDFREACCNHDLCFESAVSRDTCDSSLLKNLLASCEGKEMISNTMDTSGVFLFILHWPVLCCTALDTKLYARVLWVPARLKNRTFIETTDEKH